MSSIFVYRSGKSSLSWEQARQAVRSDLWRASSQGLPDDVVDRALHAALRRVEAERRWSWLETIDGQLTASGDTDVLDAPPSLRSVVTLASTQPPRSYEIIAPMPLTAVRQSACRSRMGTPLAYALHAGALHLDCLVADGTKFDLIFKQGVPSSLAEAIEDPSITLTKESQLVIADACRHIALTRLKNETEAGRHEGAYQQRLLTVMDEEDEERGDLVGAAIMPDNFHHCATRGSYNG